MSSLNRYVQIPFVYCAFILSLGYSSASFAQNKMNDLVVPDLFQSGIQYCIGTMVERTDYMVPLDDLQDSSAVFQMKNLAYRKCGNEIEVRYELPEDLTGIKNVVRMAGVFEPKSRTVVLSGDQGEAKCLTRTDGVLKCDVRFMNLSLDPIKAKDLLSQENLDIKDLKQKINAIGRFTGNPVGYFTVQ